MGSRFQVYKNTECRDNKPCVDYGTYYVGDTTAPLSRSYPDIPDWVAGDFESKDVAKKALEHVRILERRGFTNEDIRNTMFQIPYGPRRQSVVKRRIVEATGGKVIRLTPGGVELKSIEGPATKQELAAMLSEVPKLTLEQGLEIAAKRAIRFKRGEITYDQLSHYNEPGYQPYELR